MTYCSVIEWTMTWKPKYYIRRNIILQILIGFKWANIFLQDCPVGRTWSWRQKNHFNGKFFFPINVNRSRRALRAAEQGSHFRGWKLWTESQIRQFLQCLLLLPFFAFRLCSGLYVFVTVTTIWERNKTFVIDSRHWLFLMRLMCV